MSSPGDVDVLVSWSERLVAAAAPEEIDLAADIASAYADGGAAGRHLFGRPHVDPGAFGAGITVVLPYLLDALEHCYAVVRGLLTDPSFNSVIASGSLLVAVQQWRDNRKNGRRGSEDPPPVDPQPADVAEAMVVLNAITARLVQRGLPADRAAALAADVMRELVREPAGATEFLDLLAARRR